MINVDGYSYLNCYLRSDALFSSNQRGFTLEVSFALEGSSSAYDETSYYFDIEEYYYTSNLEHKLIRIQTNDLLSATGGVPYIGGQNLVHILRTPVLGPYVRVSVFNEDTQTHYARVIAYATT